MTAQSDHDLLIQIAGDVKHLRLELAQGADIFRDHETRLRVQEKADAECVTKSDCAKKHDDINKKFVAVLIALLVAAVGVIGTLLATR